MLGNKVAGELATGIQGVLQGMPGMTEQSAAALKQFSTEIAAFLGGNTGAGIFDLQNNPALGALPELLKSQEFKAVTAAAMPTGTKADPIAVTDSKVLDAVKATMSKAEAASHQFNERTAAVQAANRAVADIVGGPGVQMADAASAGIADDLFKKALFNARMETDRTSQKIATATDFAGFDVIERKNAMSYANSGSVFGDAGSFGLLGNGRSGINPNAATDGLTINVAGSILSENDLIEVIRQGALKNQTSGTEWAPSPSGVY